MMSPGLERVYLQWRRRDVARRQKSLYTTRYCSAMVTLNERLQARRAKLRDLIKREKEDDMNACCEKLRAQETVRKEAIIAEAEMIKQLIKSAYEAKADREYKRLFHLSSEEYRICRPHVIQMAIKEDQKVINEFKRQKGTYEKEREEILIKLGDGFSRQITDADSSRVLDRATLNKLHHNTFLQQMVENETKRKHEESEKRVNEKNMIEQLKAAIEADDRRAMERLEAQQYHSRELQDQMEMVRKRIERRESEDAEFERAIRRNWEVKATSPIDRRERLRGLNDEAKCFLQHQQQVRDHRKYSDAIADKQRAEAAEECYRKQKERLKAHQCFMQKINRETYDAQRTAVEENPRYRAQIRQQKVESEAKELLQLEKGEEESQRAREAAEAAKRKAFRVSLEKQLEEVRLRRQHEIEESEREKAAERLADEDYRRRMKNLVCDEWAWDVYTLHPWRRKGSTDDHLKWC